MCQLHSNTGPCDVLPFSLCCTLNDNLAVAIVHGGKPRPMSSAQLRFLRGRVMRYACADVLLERLEREGLISDDERKQLASDVAAACRLASGSIFRGVDDK